jgi:hypothetical protein
MIIRRQKNKNFSVICNDIFQNSNISARAKGIYAYLMTLPDDWKLYKKELYKHFTEGRDALDRAFKELELNGYIQKEQEKDESGKFCGWNYTVYETQTAAKFVFETQKAGNQVTENPKSANPHLLNTNLLQNTNNSGKSRTKEIQELFQKRYKEVTKTEPLLTKKCFVLLSKFSKKDVAEKMINWWFDGAGKWAGYSVGGLCCSDTNNLFRYENSLLLKKEKYKIENDIIELKSFEQTPTIKKEILELEQRLKDLK